MSAIQGHIVSTVTSR